MRHVDTDDSQAFGRSLDSSFFLDIHTNSTAAQNSRHVQVGFDMYDHTDPYRLTVRITQISTIYQASFCSFSGVKNLESKARILQQYVFLLYLVHPCLTSQKVTSKQHSGAETR